MADWPLTDASRIERLGIISNPTTGVTATGAGTAHVKGAWAVLGNAPFDVAGIVIWFNAQSSVTDYLVDIGLGASGSERAVVENILISGPASSYRVKNLVFPLAIRANERITFRCQNATISSTIVAQIALLEGSLEGAQTCTRFVTYGAVPSTSSGTALGAPGANAWGAWTELTPAAATDHNWIMPIFGDQDLATRTGGQKFAYQAGIGPATESELTPPIGCASSSVAMIINAFPGWWLQVPVGKRLTMRYGSSAATTLGADGIIIAGAE